MARFSAFLRAVVPGLAGLSSMHYRTFLAANAAGGRWGVLYVLLGYFVGQRVEKVTGIASDVVLGIIFVVIVVLVVRHRRKAKAEIEGPAETPRRPGATRRADRPRRSGRSAQHQRSPARSPATTRANSPAASSPWASVSMKCTAPESRRSTPKRP